MTPNDELGVAEVQGEMTMELEQKYGMSKYASKQDRAAAINRDIDRLAKKRDWAADVKGSAILAWSYQQDIDKLAELLTPNA